LRLRFEPLGNHDRAAFSCGEPSIDEFLKKFAAQRQARRLGVPIVAVDADGDPNTIVGYYFIAPHEFRGDELPDPMRRGTRVGKLSAVPGALLGQLGVSLDFQHRGVGKLLVRHALLRTLSIADTWGCVAIVTDPIDERARGLYEGFDFIPLGDESRRMILAVATIAAAFAHPSTSSG
jgi:GNAT superfamily N-acetyltransferase